MQWLRNAPDSAISKWNESIKAHKRRYGVLAIRMAQSALAKGVELNDEYVNLAGCGGAGPRKLAIMRRAIQYQQDFKAAVTA